MFDGPSRAVRFAREASSRAGRLVPTVIHGDGGTRLTSWVLSRRALDSRLIPSMGAVGNCFDNALAESFFATLECELLDRTVFENRNAARLAVFDFIETFYNPWRRHSSIGNLAPTEYERRWHTRCDLDNAA